jgi:uncharacterized protein (DUF2141 family)
MMGLRSWFISRKSLKRPLSLLAGGVLALASLGSPQLLRAEPAAGACEAVSAPTAASAPGEASQIATAPAASAAIQVTVENVRSSKGLITAVLYGDNPDTFLKKGARLDRIRVEAREGETVLCLHAPAAGRYTVALYHDENGNKALDQNFLGIPTEGYGFSNNPGFRFGKPTQKETLFTVEDGPVDLHISVLYL